jgi:hypothetical protein
MAKGIDFGTIIGLGIAGLGAWYLYENWNILFPTVTTAPAATPAGGIVAAGTPSTVTTATPTPATTTTVSTTPAVAGATPTTLQQQIQAMAGAGVNMLDPDQWNYYYNAILAGRVPPQPAVSSAVFEGILGNLGLTDATRSTNVTLPQFMQALASQGLSGIRSNRGHFRKVNYVNTRGRSSNGHYVPSGNTSPVSRGF